MATAELILERPQAYAQAWTLPAQIPELDGIRGLAILLVLICHSAMWLPMSALRSVLIEGKIGVDLFFVLSGFLITRILLDTQRDRQALRNFYVRRGLRIWPLYFSFLLVAFVALRKMMPTGLAPWTYLLFAQNFVHYANTGPVLDPTWSLAVEEQFYLLWPLIALRARRETVLKICCAVLALSPLIRCAFRLAAAPETFIYANTLCRLDGIAMGGAIAAWVRSEGFEPEQLRRFARFAVPFGVAGAGLCYWLHNALVFGSDIRHSFIALAFGGIVAWTLARQGQPSPALDALRSFNLTGLGRISFALYLFNLPLYTLIHGHMADRIFLLLPTPITEVARVILGNALLLLAAVLSWKFLEHPILRLKSRLAPR
jgi:peptidoglycan/LPS O-acetylase OafA/YrhL